VVTHQLQIERRTGKVRQSETDVLPRCHATNLRLVGLVSMVSVNFRFAAAYQSLVLRMSLTTYVLNADRDRYADALIGHAAAQPVYSRRRLSLFYFSTRRRLTRVVHARYISSLPRQTMFIDAARCCCCWIERREVYVVDLHVNSFCRCLAHRAVVVYVFTTGRYSVKFCCTLSSSIKVHNW